MHFKEILAVVILSCWIREIVTPYVCSWTCKIANCDSQVTQVEHIFEEVNNNIKQFCGLGENDTFSHLIIRDNLRLQDCMYLHIRMDNVTLVLYDYLKFARRIKYSDAFNEILNSTKPLNITFSNPYPSSHGAINNPLADIEIEDYGFWGSKESYDNSKKTLEEASRNMKCNCHNQQIVEIKTYPNLLCTNLTICNKIDCVNLTPAIISTAKVAFNQKNEVAEFSKYPVCSIAKDKEKTCSPGTPFNLPTNDNNNIVLHVKYEAAKEKFQSINPMSSYESCANYRFMFSKDYGMVLSASSSNFVQTHMPTYEESWKKELSKKWISHCVKNFPSNVAQKLQSTVDLTTPVSTSTERPCNNDDDEDNEETRGRGSSAAYAQSPSTYDPCRVMFSEVSTQNNENPTSFIELTMICPKGIRKSKFVLSYFRVLVIKIGSPSEIIINCDLGGKKLVKSDSLPRSQPFFTLGTGAISMNIYNDEHCQVADFVQNGIPREEETAYAAVLLYIPDTDAYGRAVISTLSLSKQDGIMQPKQLDERAKETVQKHVQDLILYGSHPPISQCLFFSRVLADSLTVTDDGYCKTIALSEIDNDAEIPYLSVSRCTSSNEPMLIDEYIITPPTPGQENNCEQFPSPYNLKRARLQSTAQKMVVNAYTFFQKTNADLNMCKGAPIKITSNALGIQTTNIYTTLERWRKDNIVTPGKKRDASMQTKISKLDSFHIDLIKRTIMGFYKENKPPLFNDVFREIMAKIKENEEFRRLNGDNVESFTCSKNTFRKILKKLGFRYGKIDLRIGILQRTDIVAWRARYLRAIRENDLRNPPLPVVYTDETWIEPFARTPQAWYFKTEDPKVAKLYTYKKHKIGKGGRIIVIHAGTRDGFISDALLIYKILPNKKTEDYHGNVGSIKYTDWFKKLLEILDRIGPHIIVMDNAKYHSEIEIPNSRAKKGEYWDWLQNNLPSEEKAKLNNKMLRAELWEIVKNKRKNYEEFGKLDKMAKDHGHKIIRLHPYGCENNPIEMVWSDVKREVRKLNQDQNINTVINIAKTFMENYPAENWGKHVDHVKRLEAKQRQEEGIYDNFVGSRVIIPIRDDDNEEDSESEDEDEDFDD